MQDQIVIVNTDNKERPSADMDYMQVRDLIYRENADSKITVVVQAYGNIKKTKMCVENLLKYTTDIPFELWLLDNGSEENDTLEYFKSVEYAPKKIIRLTKNITGVFALNMLMKSVKSEYCVIVPNDIIVTKNWLKNLLACAESDSKIGIVNPVSTNISNMQEETLGGFADLEEMQKKAAEFNRSDWRKWEERLRLIPTTALYRREVFENAGMFDAGFTYHFGDDDLAFRVRRAGYRLMICRDTFVHHNHYLQERNIEDADRRTEIGRKIFREKYRGLDAWDDGMNHIKEFSHYGNLRKQKSGQIDILGVDVRCGTPILDVKNKLKLESYHDFHVDAFTTDLKYYIDLYSISDAVEHDNIANITSKYRDRKFDMIVLGESINIYQEPVKVLLDLVSLLNPEGTLIIHVHNMDNIYEFLWYQGLLTEREPGEYRKMSYEDVTNALKDILLEKLDILFDVYPVIEEIADHVQKSAYVGLRDGREEKVQNLFVHEYWFWIQKA